MGGLPLYRLVFTNALSALSYINCMPKTSLLSLFVKRKPSRNAWRKFPIYKIVYENLRLYCNWRIIHIVIAFNRKKIKMPFSFCLFKKISYIFVTIHQYDVFFIGKITKVLVAN